MRPRHENGSKENTPCAKELRFYNLQLVVALCRMQGDLDVSTENSLRSSGDAVYDIDIDRDHS